MEPVLLRVVRKPSTRPRSRPATSRRRLKRPDVCTADQMRRTIARLLADGQTNIAVEVHDGNSVDSAMLWTLLRAGRVLRAVGGQLSVVTDDQIVREILRMTLLDTVLPVFADRSTALEHLEAA
jgi:anti-anti-sigma factor